MRRFRVWVWIVSMVAATFLGEAIYPTPNAVGGGTVKMCLLIILTVVIKSVIEYYLDRNKKLNEANKEIGAEGDRATRLTKTKSQDKDTV